jgi:hypothetical protein
METLDLHYSRGKLIRLAILSLVMTALGLWLALGGVSEGSLRRGPGAWLGRVLGPEGVSILGWILAATALAFALLYLRRAFADPVAARADAEGVTIHTLFGSRFYRAEDIATIELQHPAGQPIFQIIPEPGRGTTRGLAANGLVEGEGEIELWIDAVLAGRQSARG